MNVRDSEIMTSQLRRLDYEKTDDKEEADLVIVNTCSVRDKAEQKLYSDLGRLKAWKRTTGGQVVVAGCVAQQERQHIARRAPHVDLILGTHQVRDLAGHLAQIGDEGTVTATEWKHDDPYARLGQPDPVEQRSPSAFVTIQEGCDNVCSFCIVPFTRGREVSRPPDAVVAEIEQLVQGGVVEIVLVGQNVNSYGYKYPEFGTFSQLLRRISEIDGVERIRFTSPHPKDYGDDLIAAYRDLPKLCPGAHLPLQAGSDSVLAAMKRGYTADDYLKIVTRLREVRPDIQFSTDIIVGFPGEDRAAFEETLRVTRAVRYSQIYAFVYSPRPMTPGARLEDPVLEHEKKSWLQELFALQKQIQEHDHQAFCGSNTMTLWTDLDESVLRGRNPQGRVVHAEGSETEVGCIEAVFIERATSNALYGRRVTAS